MTGALTGDSNTAVAFNGSTQKVTLPGTLLGTVPDSGTAFAFSVEAWVKYTTAAAELFAVAFGNSGNSGPILGISRDPAGTGLQAYFRGLGTTVKATQAVAHNDGLWHHVVITFDRSDTAAGAAGTARIFVDGTQRATGQLPVLGGTFNRGSIGNLPRTGEGLWWSGSVDEVAVYGYTLSSTRIGVHYTAGTTAPPTTVTLTPATETDSAVARSLQFTTSLTPASEVDTAPTLALARHRQLVAATEADAAVALGFGAATPVPDTRPPTFLLIDPVTTGLTIDSVTMTLIVDDVITGLSIDQGETTRLVIDA